MGSLQHGQFTVTQSPTVTYHTLLTTDTLRTDTQRKERRKKKVASRHVLIVF
jgi:hypothetical protein